MASCPWRPLLLLALAVLLIAAINAARNELMRRELQYSAAVSLSALDGERSAEVAALALPSPTKTVADFTRQLTEEEVLGWKQTPRYTATGYCLPGRLPLGLRQRLVEFHASSAPQREEPNGHLRGEILLASLAHSELEWALRVFLEGLLEDWTGQRPLRFVNSYGPRTYTRGATLAAHGDRIRTHAVSAIVFVAASSDARPWPLQFVANGTDGRDAVHEVFLSEQADVLLYESTQPHGRVEPLDGQAFSALFLHWQPPGWREHVDRLLA
jgi:hypothetical protein